MSNSFPLNPLTLSGLGRSNTPPTATQQSSPNSFLQGLSSRLRSQQQQIPLPSSGGGGGYQGSGFGGGTSSNFGTGGGGFGLGTGQGGTGVPGSNQGSRSGIMDIFDSANIPGPASTFGFSSSTSSTRGNNNFGIPPGPPSFDINEFPTLSGNISNSNNSVLPSSAPGSNRPNYVGQLVKDVHSNIENYNKPTFDMNEYDFPALPGSGAPGSEQARAAAAAAALRNSIERDGNSGAVGQSVGGQSNAMPNIIGGYGSDMIGDLNRSRQSTISAFDSIDARGLQQGNINLPPSNMANVTKSGKKGIVTTKEGKVSNIPMGMVTDQFGMIGLLTFIRAAETEQNIVSLALGTDLTSLKLDLNSSDTLYSTFPGPWSDTPLKPHEIDYPVPSEYLIHHQVRDKLASIREKLSRYGDDTLFFLFYMFPNDLLQIGAANEL